MSSMSLFRRKPAPVVDEPDFGSWGSALRDPVEPSADEAAEIAGTPAPSKRGSTRNGAEHLAAAKGAMAAAKQQRDDDASSDASQP
jgi:hypothetical protein